MDRILYFVDRSGVSQGYKPIFNALLLKAGIQQCDIITTDIYSIVQSPLHRVGNRKTWTLDPEKAAEVEYAFQAKINALNPTLIVVSCNAILGILATDLKFATVDATRGGVYEYKGTPVVVVYPITATNFKITDKTNVGKEEGINDYKIKTGSWILANDWKKVGRFFRGKLRIGPAFDYCVVRTREDIPHAVKFLTSCVFVASDIETKIVSQTCVGYCGVDSKGRMKSYVFPLYDAFVDSGCYWDLPGHMEVVQAIQTINASPNYKGFQNGSYDCSYFVRDRMPPKNYLFDSMHLWHAIYPELLKRLDFISSILLDNYTYWKEDRKGLEEEDESKRDKNMERYWKYNAKDCYYTAVNILFLIQIVFADKRFLFNYGQEFMQQLAGWKMSMKGIKADKDLLFDMKMELAEITADAQIYLRIITDDPQFNARSVPQKVDIIYGLLGAAKRDDKGRPIGPKSKKSPSTGDNAFKLIKTEHPIFNEYIEAIQSVIRPLYSISNICNMKMRTGRFRYKLAVTTETTRYAGKASDFWDGTNPQNIQKFMRKWLIADEGHLLFDFDFRQSDAVFVAFESNDRNYINTVTSGRDSHCVHAAHFFKCTYEEVYAGAQRDDPKYTDSKTGIRQLTKRIVHGANFQMRGYTLYVVMSKESVIATAKYMGYKDAHRWKEKQLVQFCQMILNGYRKLYPRLSNKEWYGEIKQLLIDSGGFITNAFGITRKFMGDPENNATQREATAQYGQSNTAGNMNRVLNEVEFGIIPPRFRDGPNPHAKEKPLLLDYHGGSLAMLLQVHDSFVGQANLNVSSWREDLNSLLTVMERPIIINGHEMYVPADAMIGPSWGKSMIPWDRKDPFAIDRIIVHSP